MALLDDVVDYLADQGLVNDGTWRAEKGYLSEQDDRVVAVFETPGGPPDAEKTDAETAYDRVGFQVRVRGDRYGYAAARTRLGAIYRALHRSTLAPATGEPAYVDVRAVQSGPLPLGLDENGRPGFTWNFEALRERG